MRRFLACVVFCLFIFLLIKVEIPAQAQTTSELQAQIDTSNKEIEKLRAEIAELQKQLTTTAKERQTLQNAINELNLSIQKLQKNISLTQAQIDKKDLEIGDLSLSIDETTNKITRSEKGIATTLRELQAQDDKPLALVLFAEATLSSFFDESVVLETLRSELGNQIDDLAHLREDLKGDKTMAEGKRKELSSLSERLGQEKQGLGAAKETQNKLLQETKSKEATYQSKIAEKQALQAKFEQDLSNYEAQLNLIVNPGSFAAAKAGILRWPVDQPFVTQYFGNTAFATQNPQVYGGRGHNAIDLRASAGTLIRAALGGTVRGTGNTDLTCTGASYGKWVFIDHPNGLSTLYAHLSSISVTDGGKVEAGQVIGYSGQTGYATGPHLHFGVYASSGAKIASFPSKSCVGKTYTMPVADPSAYLNPLSYLPTL